MQSKDSSVSNQLLELCKSDTLSADAIDALLKLGAKADFCRHEEGTWGAREVTSCLNEVLRTSRKLYQQVLYANKADDGEEKKRKQLDEIAQNCAKMCKILLDNGAKPTELFESYDWRGCGSSQVRNSNDSNKQAR